MTIICIASNKGGAGKTTTSVSLAAALANFEPTLLADLDQQGECGLAFGLPVSSGLYDWTVRGLPLADCTRPGRPDQLSILPGDSHTKLIDRAYSAAHRSAELVGMIRSLPATLVVLDTPPGGYMQEIAIKAADLLVIPFRPEAVGIMGVYNTLALARALNPQLEAARRIILLPVAMNVRIKDQQENLAQLVEEYGALFGLAPYEAIHQAHYVVQLRAAVAQCPNYGLTVWEHRAKGIEVVRSAYSLLVGRVLEMAAKIELEQLEVIGGNG